jgi:hypothetical protein
MADVFKFTEDQQTALKLIGGTVRNLLLFGGSRSGKTLILLFSIVLRASMGRHIVPDTQAAKTPKLIGPRYSPLHSPKFAGESPANLPGESILHRRYSEGLISPLNSSAHLFSAELHELKKTISRKTSVT